MKQLVGRTALFAVLAFLVIAETTRATPGSGITSANLSVGRIGAIDAKTETDSHEVELRTKGSSDVYTPSQSLRYSGGAFIVAQTHVRRR